MVVEREFKFTVASQLLRELGERLVRRASTALGELVKNAYDADAFHVEIRLEPRNPEANFEGRIEVRDSGHGMTRSEFRDYWMRIGDDRKAVERFSPYLTRPLAGSKGVGRIAAQYLSHKLRIETISVKQPDSKLVAWLDWDEAVERGDLHEVGVRYREESAGPLEYPGTTVVLEDLKQGWDRREIVNLAHDIWTLEPPFRKRDQRANIRIDEIPPLPPEGQSSETPRTESGQDYRRPEDFAILFYSPYEEATREFEGLRRQVMNLWAARIVGRIRSGNPLVSIEFRGEEPLTEEFRNLRGTGPAKVEDAFFEILLFDPRGRQPGGIPVRDVREYLRDHGGVHIFYHGFRLPYYGEVQNDWLRITYDHARRLSVSELLPEELKVPEGMYYMPTYHQVFGFVEIRAGDEDKLVISISRDRLEEDTPAFAKLRDVVRASLHWYGSLRTLRLREDIAEKPVKPRKAVSDVTEVLRLYERQIPKKASRMLEKAARRTARALQAEESGTARQLAALSGYATAGIAAIAYHHEIVHQLSELEQLAEELEESEGHATAERNQILRLRLLNWTARIRQLSALFAPYLEEENVQEERRFRAKAVVDDVLIQMGTILERVSVDTDLQDDMRLPKATYIEWISILQNVLFNALNALQDSERPRIRISSEVEGKSRRIVVEDSGIGVDLSSPKELFRPFVRGIAIDPTLGELGYGGSGLGLTIVKMIAERRDSSVGFRKPSKEFSTRFVLEWEEE